ncbi:concanavalin A-like lectin/glucanase domain-containing protein [Rhizophagus diaphanus]|nr:concanavalin A-like lectin/glucanase domain-containing protein [Rhizophagus diaphanus] [Rhizophagus sp. MUCL 43196]
MAIYLRPSLIRSFRRTPIITLKPSSNLFIANPHVTCRRNSSTTSENLDDLNINKSPTTTTSPTTNGITKGYSLEQDLRSLINHPERSDIEILCKDGKRLFGCKAILASRSEIFDKLIYKEGNQKQISLPKIQYSGMENILEYFYTGSIKEFLSRDNILETYQAAKYFNISTIQDFIINELQNTLEKNYEDNLSPELLSKALEMILVNDDDKILNLLVKSLAMIPLNDIKYDRLSIKGLQYLLQCTLEKEMKFATTEYDVLRYSSMLAAKQVSNQAYKSLMQNFPTLDKAEEQIKKWLNFRKKFPKGWFIVDRRIIIKKLKPFIKFIDFKRIKKEIIYNIIKPLRIIPNEIIESMDKPGSKLNDIRGIPILYKKDTKFDYIWDDVICGRGLKIKDNGKVVQAKNNTIFRQNVRTIKGLEKGIFEWEIIIEKSCEYTSIGVCGIENFDHEIWAGYQSNGWVLNFNGYCYNSGKCNYYCEPFTKDGTKIIVHLDMNLRTCAFTVNGTKYPEVSEWNNLPSKLYPVVSLCASARCRIQPHQTYDSSNQKDN